MSKSLGGIKGCKYKTSSRPRLDLLSIPHTEKNVKIVFNIQRIGCQPEKKLLYTVANPARGLLNKEK